MTERTSRFHLWNVIPIASVFFTALLLTLVFSIGVSAESEHTYEIGFYTLNSGTFSCNDPGTNSSVYVTFICENGESERFECDGPGNDFYDGGRDDYCFTGKELGKVLQIKIQVDGSDGLCLDKMFFEGTECNMLGEWIDDQTKTYTLRTGGSPYSVLAGGTVYGLTQENDSSFTYKVGVHTDDVSQAQSLNNWYIIVAGEKGAVYQLIDGTGARDSDEYYDVTGGDVGTVAQVYIKLFDTGYSTTDAWCLERMYFQGKTYHANGFWLKGECLKFDVYYGEKADLYWFDNMVFDTTKYYKIGFHTDDETNGGTDMEVLVSFICENGTTCRFNCDNDGDDMETDDDDYYSFYYGDLGQVKQIKIEYNYQYGNYTDNWCMGRIYFQDKTYNTNGYWWAGGEEDTFDVYYGDATYIDVMFGVMTPQLAGSVFSKGSLIIICSSGAVLIAAAVITLIIVKKKKRTA